jgi:hypothetical protein
LACVHVEHWVAGSEPAWSCACKQVTVVARGLAGSQAVVIAPQTPDVRPVVIAHCCPGAQVPQLSVPPHPSGAVPQVEMPHAAAGVFGTHAQRFP